MLTCLNGALGWHVFMFGRSVPPEIDAPQIESMASEEKQSETFETQALLFEDKQQDLCNRN